MKKVKSISVEQLQLGDIDSWADFAWYYAPDKFINAFAKKGILVEDEKDVSDLVDLYKRRGDINGELKNKAGQSIYFNVLEIIKNDIPVDKLEIRKKFIASDDFHLVKRLDSFISSGSSDTLRGHVTVQGAGGGVKITCLNNGILTTFNYPQDGTIDQGQAFANSCKNNGGAVTYTRLGLYTRR